MTTSGLAESHPSYLALDRAGSSDDAALSPELRAHLQSCAECRDYVAALAEPAPASGFAQLQQRVQARRRAKVRGLFLWAPAVAAAASALLFIALRPQPELPAGPRPEQPYLGSKGFTSVWIYVKHGPNTELWDGKRALFAGDRVRLKLDPGQFRRVAVYSVSSADSPALLYEGPVTPGESTTLPDAWELDAEPGAERLVVVFGKEALQPVWPDWLQGKVPPGVSVLPFVLPKSSAPDPDAGSINP